VSVKKEVTIIIDNNIIISDDKISEDKEDEDERIIF